MDKASAYEFLNRLNGSWELTGRMGDIPLKQDVVCKPVLGGTFIEMNFRSVFSSPKDVKPYEALYLAGYDDKEGMFVLNLFDTFGVASSPVPGLGKLKDNCVEFVFKYDTGPFINKFEFLPAENTWKFTQYFFENNEKKIFAEKVMVKK